MAQSILDTLANSKTAGYTGSLFTGYRGDEAGKGAESTYGKNTFDDPTDKGELKALLTAVESGTAIADGGRIKGVDGPELHKDDKGYFTHMHDNVHGGSITVRLQADANGKLSLAGDPAQAVQYEAGHGGWLDNNLGVSGNDIAKVAAVAAAIYTGGAALGAWGAEAGAAAGAAGAAGTAGELAAANAAAAAGTLTAEQAALLTAAETSTASVGGWSLGGTLSNIATNTLKNAAIQAIRTGKVDFNSAVKGGVLGEIGGQVSQAVGGWAKEALPEGTSNWISKGIGNAAGSAAVAGITGQDIGKSILNSGINTTVGHYVGDPIKDFTGSKEVGDVATGIAGQLVRGNNPNIPGIIGGVLTNSLFKFENPYLKDFNNNAMTGGNQFANNAYSTGGWSGGKP